MNDVSEANRTLNCRQRSNNLLRDVLTGSIIVKDELSYIIGEPNMNDTTSSQPSDSVDESTDSESKKFGPLTSVQRRVVGVLVEKSKTTPAGYPMTLNSVRTASNQKSNRFPQMELREEQVEDALYELRHLGAAAEVHSGGRVPKYKHYLYEWLGVEKAELAVMAELLLRGAQTLGDLRARASRMDKISGLDELKPIVRSLLDKGLMVELTPAGRGQVVTHNLYLPEELERLQAEHDGVVPAAPRNQPAKQSSSPAPAINNDRIEELEARVLELEQSLDSIQERLDRIEG